MKKIITDMDFEDDVSFFETSRIVKICFVGLMFLISLACLVGVFGYGVWTRDTVGHQKDMLVEYECFLRVTKETPLTCFVNTSDLQDSLIHISLSNEYLQKVDLKQISPEPCKVITQNDRLTFCFRSVPGNKSLQPVSFTTVAKKSGNIKATVYSNREQYSISQYIYP
jgi:hypothetical protein